MATFPRRSCRSADPSGIIGRVVAVADGDTITVLVAGNRQVKVRLAEIDTPEKKQPWGRKAKKTTSDLVFGRQVQVEVLKKDRYRRSVGRVFVDGKNVGRELVAGGNAWVYRGSVQDTCKFLQSCSEANYSPTSRRSRCTISSEA